MSPPWPLTEFLRGRKYALAGLFTMVFTPSGVPSALSAPRLANNPTVTTPGIALMAFLFSAMGRDFHTINIQNHVAVIRDHVLTVLRRPPSFNCADELTRRCAPSESTTGNGNLPRIVHLFRGIRNNSQISSATEAILFTGYRRAAAF